MPPIFTRMKQYMYGGLVLGQGGSFISKILSATASLNFGSITNGLTADLTITVTGAASGDDVIVTPPSTIEAGLIFAGFVSAANTVKIRVGNMTAAPVDPAAGVWRATVIKH